MRGLIGAGVFAGMESWVVEWEPLVGLCVCHARAGVLVEILRLRRLVPGYGAGNDLNNLKRRAGTTRLRCDYVVLGELVEYGGGAFAHRRVRGRRYDTVHWARTCALDRVDEDRI